MGTRTVKNTKKASAAMAKEFGKSVFPKDAAGKTDAAFAEEETLRGTDASSLDGPEKKKKRGPQKKSAAVEGPRRVVCYVDTEFNGNDYHGHNRGYQDVVQIGAAVTVGGRIKDRFVTYCALPKGMVASRRLKSLTGITKEMLDGAPSFAEAAGAFTEFVDRYMPEKIYSYGGEDGKRLAETARHCRIDDGHVAETLAKVTDIMPEINKGLGIKNGSSQLSVAELCRICGVGAGAVHDALNDAVRLGRCAGIIEKKAFSKKILKEITEEKKYRINYYNKRQIREPVWEDKTLDREELDSFLKLIDSASESGKYSDFTLDAIRDDVLTLAGLGPVSPPS